MRESSLQESSIHQFSYQATCLRGNKVKRICISSAFCKGNNIFLCGRSEEHCECHFQHKNCSTIGFDSFLNKFTNYKKSLSDELVSYIQRFEKIFTHLQKKISKELQMFKSHYESILFDEIKSSIEQKIQNKKFNSISSFEINQFLNSLELFSQEINCGKLSLNQARELDKKMIDLFQYVQNLYKQKISRKKVAPTSQHKARSLSSTSLQKSFTTLESSNHLRKSSMMERPNLIKNDQLSSNFSLMLQKKKPSDIEEIRFDQNLLLRPPKIDLTYPKSISSKIIDNCSLINHFIGRKVKSYELEFRASQNNFEVPKFYERIEKLQPIKEKFLKNKQFGSLFLVKTQFNHIFGDFTQVPLVSCLMQQNSKDQTTQSETQTELNPEQSKSRGKRKFCNDIKSSTFIFSINLQQKYALADPQKAIYRGSKSIGFGNSDIRIKNKSNIIRQNVCRIGDTFKFHGSNKHIAVEYDTKNMKIIGSRYGKKFKISEWQYFTVIFDRKL